MKVAAKMRLQIVKKLWGYIKRKRNRFTILISVNVESEKKENTTEVVDVEVQHLHKGKLIDSLTASAKLRTFKATEPEI